MTVKPVILATGATGNQGSAVTKCLVGRGTFMVRLPVRNKTSEKAKVLETLGVELVVGDFEVLHQPVGINRRALPLYF